MHFKFRNVNEAFRGLVAGIHDGSVPTERRPSRNGGVRQIAEPVILTYEKPLERTLFNAARDANPFFHVMEALWMLAGRDDVASVAYYAKQMKEYSDDGVVLNGAYGYRWRHATRDAGLSTHVELEDFDQLDVIVNHLKAQPESRRAVLQMWNVEDDLLKIGPGPDTSKDTCCNLSVMFSLRDALVNRVGATEPCPFKVLDMTVTNRSNDLVWGALGANYCHFSFLQEYMAARLGAGVGVYNQFSNNMHVYDWNWKPEEWLADTTPDYYAASRQAGVNIGHVPLVSDPAAFDREVQNVVTLFDGSRTGERFAFPEPSEPFLATVAVPMFQAFGAYKVGDFGKALMLAGRVRATDWRVASTNWLLRRKGRAESKQAEA